MTRDDYLFSLGRMDRMLEDMDTDLEREAA